MRYLGFKQNQQAQESADGMGDPQDGENSDDDPSTPEKAQP